MNEVFRRVGRNLLLFQHIELLLKALLSGAGFAGYASEIQAKAAQRAQEISGKTLGQLAQQYHDEILGQSDSVVAAPAEPREPWLSFSFRREVDKAAVDRDRAVLDALVTERNELAHTFLARWNLSEPAEIDAAIRCLDDQRERALPVLDHMKSILGGLERGRKEVADVLTNGEFARQLELAWLQQSRIIQLFQQIAETSARADGWTDLTAAGRLVHERAHEDAVGIKERYAVTSLKRLLVVSELFDVTEEPDGGGHVRTLYRNRAERPN